MSSSAPKPYSLLEEIEQLVSAFENCTLPRTAWTHQAHLTIGAWYLAKHPRPAATQFIRDGILELNRAHGTVNDADHGYHETITLFYVGAIAHYLRTGNGNSSLLATVNALLTTRGHKELPFEYYSRERLMSREGRARWIEPDLKPFEWNGNDSSDDDDRSNARRL